MYWTSLLPDQLRLLVLFGAHLNDTSLKTVPDFPDPDQTPYLTQPGKAVVDCGH